MRITKFGHACVRVGSDDDGSSSVVIDPGMFTGAGAVDGVDAVLITHEHPDHFHLDHLRATDAPVYTIRDVADRITEQAPDVAERTSIVSPGERLDLAGFAVRAVGELHAVIHAELPRFYNSGYVLEADGRRVFHPGDALNDPGADVDVLCLPVSAPWLKASQAIDFAREVHAPYTLAIHDRVYSEAGLQIMDGHVRGFLGPEQTYARVADGEELPLPG